LLPLEIKDRSYYSTFGLADTFFIWYFIVSSQLFRPTPPEFGVTH